MFKLYGNNNGMQLLDVSHDEMDIVETLGSYIGILDEIDYIVIDSNEKSDDVKEVIKNYNDYLGYKHSVYNKKNKNNSCDMIEYKWSSNRLLQFRKLLQSTS